MRSVTIRKKIRPPRDLAAEHAKAPRAPGRPKGARQTGITMYAIVAERLARVYEVPIKVASKAAVLAVSRLARDHHHWRSDPGVPELVRQKVHELRRSGIQPGCSSWLVQQAALELPEEYPGAREDAKQRLQAHRLRQHMMRTETLALALAAGFHGFQINERELTEIRKRYAAAERERQERLGVRKLFADKRK